MLGLEGVQGPGLRTLDLSHLELSLSFPESPGKGLPSLLGAEN